MPINGKQEPVNEFDRIGSLKWRWNGKYVQLHELNDSQLVHITRFVNERRGSHYGHSSEFWFNRCNQLIKCRKLDAIICKVFKIN